MCLILHVHLKLRDLGIGQRYFRSLNCLDRLRDTTRVKTRHTFLAKLTKILKQSLSVRKTFLVRNLMAKC